MILWILMGLTGIASFFYGRYYRLAAARAEERASKWEKEYGQAVVNFADRTHRYEDIINKLKADIAALEEHVYEARDPESIRILFRKLFPPPSKS